VFIVTQFYIGLTNCDVLREAVRFRNPHYAVKYAKFAQ